MDRVTLTDKGLVFMARYAAPSIMTGNFAACIVGADIESVREAFTHPGTIHVHNMDGLYPDASYTGFSGIKRVRVSECDIVVTVCKGEDHATDQ